VADRALAARIAAQYHRGMRATLSIALGLCLSLTAEALAQAPADDMAYCAQLSALYRRYLGNTG
jgi:uncharacterized membrane protein YhhN